MSFWISKVFLTGLHLPHVTLTAKQPAGWRF